MSAAFGLDSLLTALREAGLTVGISEVARLRQVFALGPEILASEDRRLKAVLRAILVKSAEDRALFDPVFDAWLDRAGQELNEHTALAAEPKQTKTLWKTTSPPPLPPPSSSIRHPRRFFWEILASLVLILSSLSLSKHGKTSPEVKTPSYKPQKVGITPAEIRTHRFTAWVPTLTVIRAKSVGEIWQARIFGGFALLTAGGLWLALRRRHWLPEPALEPLKKGPPRVFLTPPSLTGPQLLEPRELESLVWGIGHFVADEPTRRLDLPATVRETARAGGIPLLRFHQARHPREVWLWVDEATDDPAVQRLASEVEAALQAHNLPVERALFRGVPDWLINSAGQAFAPNEVDERRDAALVAILTDGRILARGYAADDRRVYLDALLRNLSCWPRLAIVDFSVPPSDLACILAKHPLLRIAPAELAAFLGIGETTKQKLPSASPDDAIWAGACALAPSSVDEARAFEIRRRLGLATSPWVLQALRIEAPGPPGRLLWNSVERARRVNWLRQAEAQTGGTVASSSLLGKALDLWEEAYDREIENRQAGASEGIWLGTPAYQHLAMERALLALWRDPANAVRQLYQFHGGALREVIRRHLHNLAPLDWGEAEQVHLPWPWAERTSIEQVMLQEMGLGGGMPAAALRRPGRFFVGLGICLGLATGALTAAAVKEWRLEPPVLLHSPGEPAEAWNSFQSRHGSNWTGANWLVAVGTRKSLVVRPVSPGDRVGVRWTEQSLPCVEELMDGETWSCGTIERSSRLPKAIIRRVVVLATSPKTPGASELAVDLLDSGSADQVILSSDWTNYPSQLLLHHPSNQEVLVLSDSEWRALRPALRFEGTRPLAQVWPNLRLLAGERSSLLNGLSALQRTE